LQVEDLNSKEREYSVVSMTPFRPPAKAQTQATILTAERIISISENRRDEKADLWTGCNTLLSYRRA
jgi:hypothetical protein